MSVNDTIVSELKAASTVTDLVSTRIYADYAYAKAAMPYIVVSQIDSVRHPHMKAASGLVSSRIQVDCVSSTRATRDAVGDAVRLVLDTVTGSIGTDPNDQTIQYSALAEDRNFTQLPDTSNKRGGQRGTFTRSMDFMVWHAETVPTF